MILVFFINLQQKINEKPQVIADYECGKAIPNNQIMGKIERVLGKDPELRNDKLLVTSSNEVCDP